MTGYVDLQLNGYGGVDFNGDDLTLENFRRSCELLREHGVAGFLATVITADLAAMCHRLAGIVQHCTEDSFIREMVLGIHIEGPFISREPGFVGAHPVAAVRPATVDAMQRLLDAAGGMTKIVTLDPEQDKNFAVTSMLVEQGIIVAAGHCDPGLRILSEAIAAGLSMFTHLGNGCQQKLHRHDNIVQRVLSLSDKLWISFIADGAHVPLFALKNYLTVTGFEKAIVVSDAISAGGLGPGTYPLAEQQVVIGDDLVPWAEDRSHFIGSACPLYRMEQNLRSIGITEGEIQKLLIDNPRTLLHSPSINVV